MLAVLRRRCVDPIVALLTQGTTPEKIALSIAIGGVVGVFPVLGTTTVLCTFAAALLRLNLVAVQTVHFAMTPAQLLLIIPFVRVGERASGSPPQPLSISEGLALIADGALRAVYVLWDAIVHAMLGWLLLGPLAIAILYLVLRPILHGAAAKLRNAQRPTQASISSASDL